MRRLVLVRRMTVLTVATAAACGDASVPEPDPGAGGASSSADASASTSTSGPTTATASSSTGLPPNPDDPFGCLTGPIPQRPAAIPEGYRPYGCWSTIKSCLLWIPDEPEAQVAPVEWGDCAPGSPGGDGCRQMEITWPHGERWPIEVVSTGGPQLDTRGAEPLLRLTRLSLDGTDTPYIEYLVASIDGPVRYAFRRVSSEEAPCRYQDNDLHEGTWVLGPYGFDDGQDPQLSAHDGAMVIDIATRSVSLPYRDADPGISSWKAGGGRLLRYAGARLLLQEPPGSVETPLHVQGDDALGASATFNIEVVGERVVWDVASTHTLGIRSYDPEHGSRDLVRYLDDPSRGAGGVGTDGVDLVWMEGSGRILGEHHYPKRDIVTSPFTTDPGALRPRRLRSQIAPEFGGWPLAYEVACGRAARSGATSTHDVQIVRLSDGRGWELVHTPFVWRPASVVGMTCDEILLLVQTWGDGIEGRPTIQRIRFDALGEGTPPD